MSQPRANKEGPRVSGGPEPESAPRSMSARCLSSTMNNIDHNMGDQNPPALAHLCVTVGTSPLPVLATIAALRAARVTAITSRESLPTWRRIKAALASTVVGVRTSEIQVVNDDMRSVMTSGR